MTIHFTSFACILLAVSLVWAALPANADAPATAPTVLQLWDNAVPMAQGESDADHPSLKLFLPSPKPAKPVPAFLVIPGGAYMALASDHEGDQVARWLNSHGIAAFVLKYRLGPKYHYPVQLLDGQRAIRTIRFHSKDWGIDPDHVGVWGFSAGGHLASLLSTHFDDGNTVAGDDIDHEGCRPNAAVLSYPVISTTENFTHTFSRENLLGRNPTQAVLDDTSTEKKVTADTPPTFIVYSNDDPVNSENGVAYYLALKHAKVSAELHIYDFGEHGYGLGVAGKSPEHWPDLLAAWLKRHAMLP